jgi:hypothetical protein
MKENTNPLDNIKIASPCSADWNKMYGSERKRFCAECKLNVYNISEMTQEEAENLIIRSEGRLCLRIFRRADGTVITRNCPVGWARVKRRLSMVRTAVFGIVGGFIAGVFGLVGMRGLEELTGRKMAETVATTSSKPEGVSFGLMGGTTSIEQVGVDILTSRF